MGGGPASRCVGRVYGTDGAVRRTTTITLWTVGLSGLQFQSGRFG